LQEGEEVEPQNRTGEQNIEQDKTRNATKTKKKENKKKKKKKKKKKEP